MLNAPYHLNGLMSGYRDVGWRCAPERHRQVWCFVQINAAYTAPAPARKDWAAMTQTIPAGTGGVNPQLKNETPIGGTRPRPAHHRLAGLYRYPRCGKEIDWPLPAQLCFRATTGETTVALRAQSLQPTTHCGHA
jgi:hypothetical protein